MSGQRQAAQPTIDQLVAAEQVRALYAGIKKTAIVAPLATLALLALLWPVVDHQNAILWWCVLFLTLTPVSLGFLYYFQHHNRLPLDADYWIRVFVVRQCFALASSLVGYLIWVPHALQYQFIVVCYFVAVGSMIVSDLAYHQAAYRVSLPLCLGPIIVLALSEGDSVALAIIVGGMLVYLLGSARSLNRVLLESLRLRFTNDELVRQLQSEKAAAESARVEAVEANRAKSRFLAAASHDLRQPMHALGLFATAVRPHVADEEGQRIVEKIEQSIASTESLFNGLLDISRLDAGIMTPDIKPLAVGDLLGRLAVEYAPRAEAKGLFFRVKARTHTVLSDKFLLERILRNYLSNAIRNTRHGGILVGCRVRGAMLNIEVWDTGCGIPADKLEDIYQEFYQIGNSERDRTLGLGLGLAIVKRTAELLLHPIAVRSKFGRGSMFSVRVPLTTATARSAVDDDVTPVDDSRLIGATVLVIDDEADVRTAMQVLLKQWGCAVVTAESRAQALATLRRLDRAPDVILADYRLREGETGIAAIQAIQLEWGLVPAALVTGDTAPDRLVETAGSGYALLHKPFSPARVKVAVCRLLASDKQHQPAEAL